MREIAFHAEGLEKALEPVESRPRRVAPAAPAAPVPEPPADIEDLAAEALQESLAGAEKPDDEPAAPTEPPGSTAGNGSGNGFGGPAAGGPRRRDRPGARIPRRPPAGRSSHVQPVGAWRSLVAHLLGVQVVAGSNPAAPTNHDKGIRSSQWPILPLRSSRPAPVERRMLRRGCGFPPVCLSPAAA